MIKHLIILLVVLAACQPAAPVIITATPSPRPTALPTPDDWLGLPRNPGSDLDGEPITDVMISVGNPQVVVQHPPSWDLYGVPVIRWPAVYRRFEGLPSQYEYNVSYLSGSFGLGQFEVACPGKCVIAIETHFDLHTTSWTLGAIYFSVALWPTSGHSGACNPTVLVQQSPPAPMFGSDTAPWSAAWLITSGDSDWYGRFTFTIPWPVFQADSRLWIHTIAISEVGPGYGDEPVEVACQ